MNPPERMFAEQVNVMSAASKQRGRQERIESLGIPKPRFMQWWERSNKVDWAFRVAMAAVAALAILVCCRTWRPPFAYRTGAVPSRDLITRVTFQVPDEAATEVTRTQKRRDVLALYSNRTQPIIQLRGALKDQLFLILGATSFDQMNEEDRKAFAQFYAGDETAEPGDTPAARFALFKSVLADDPELQKVDDAVRNMLQPIDEHGLLTAMQHAIDQGSQRMIRVYPAGRPADAEPFELSKVRIAQVRPDLQKRLAEQFRLQFPGDPAQTVARMISEWIGQRLPDTLQYDDELTEKERQKVAADVEPVMTTHYRGDTKLADAGKSLGPKQILLLKREWEELTAKIRWRDSFARMSAYLGMIGAFYLLCGTYIFFVDDRALILERSKLAKLLILLSATVVLSYYASRDEWRGELIPLVLSSIVCAVVYGREPALLFMAAACLSVTLLLGADISELVMMAAACTSCTLLLGRIRSRTHLLYVGCISAAITMATVLGVGIVTGQTLAAGEPVSEINANIPVLGFYVTVGGLLREAAWAGMCIVVSATAMTGLLPLVEKGFGIQTDLSLLELGDASHPLLRRLAQRAPGTYNHSINVASIAEAAADSIGANGLLVRVGAYFHDIGKMFKPEYFIENQSHGINQHDSLQPAMSTLVIIAHVKDGADLARSHHLPGPIIDFILQHHGTTLVEYFYREAAKRSEEDPNGESVSDKDFRYPGPKPQSLEAAVLMLADTVESASRTLVDPTPARISGLVTAISQKKMADGQFDECGLTFRQLDRIRQSLVKSLTAIYHARVKYPGQQSA